jgi:hypothetical protein
MAHPAPTATLDVYTSEVAATLIPLGTEEMRTFLIHFVDEVKRAHDDGIPPRDLRAQLDHHFRHWALAGKCAGDDDGTNGLEYNDYHAWAHAMACNVNKDGWFGVQVWLEAKNQDDRHANCRVGSAHERLTGVLTTFGMRGIDFHDDYIFGWVAAKDHIAIPAWPTVFRNLGWSFLPQGDLFGDAENADHPDNIATRAAHAVTVSRREQHLREQGWTEEEIAAW